jgi:hypothetical protein
MVLTYVKDLLPLGRPFPINFRFRMPYMQVICTNVTAELGSFSFLLEWFSFLLEAGLRWFVFPWCQISSKFWCASNVGRNLKILNNSSLQVLLYIIKTDMNPYIYHGQTQERYFFFILKTVKGRIVVVVVLITSPDPWISGVLQVLENKSGTYLKHCIWEAQNITSIAIQ